MSTYANPVYLPNDIYHRSDVCVSSVLIFVVRTDANRVAGTVSAEFSPRRAAKIRVAAGGLIARSLPEDSAAGPRWAWDERNGMGAD